MKNVFLSASVPDPLRNPKYFESADLIAIRDAVCALAQIVLPIGKIVWGGHPMITHLIRIVAEGLEVDTRHRVVLYQSLCFAGKMPEDNNAFEHIIYTPDVEGNRDKSLQLMREKMITSHDFDAAVFIGGMEGIEEEYAIFKHYHSKATILPITTTGAAAKIIYEQEKGRFNNSLETDYAYLHLFRELLGIERNV